MNNLTTDTLQVGQQLVIPGTGGGTTPDDGEISETIYTVQKGDSLWSIASQFGVTVQDLRDINNLITDTLTIGQQLIIPKTSEEILPDDSFDVTHIVQRGESLWSIANQYDITVDELKRANNLVSNTLSIGQVLIIPTTLPPDNNQPPGQATQYTVQRGDSLWSIAKNFGITVDELKRANNLSSNTLQIGQLLTIPSNNNDDPQTTVYTVVSGDSLWLIANRYNTTVDELKRLNNLSSNILQIGQQLLIPTGLF